jgi:hypothetical protein
MQSWTQICLGDDARTIPRKSGLAAEFFYEGEPVCVSRGEQRTVGIIKSINGDVAACEGEIITELGNNEIHPISFRNVPFNISKLIGAFSLAPSNEKLMQKLRQREKIRQQVEAGFKRRSNEFVRATFESHKDRTREIILAPSLGPALSDLGMRVDAAEIDELLKSRDLNDDGGLDLQEFRALVGAPHPIEEWARELPLYQLVADAMPREDCRQQDQLRHLSSTTLEELEESVEVIREHLCKILHEKLAVLKETYTKLDSQAGAASNSKFQIGKMSVGNIADFHNGLASRIGNRLRNSLYNRLIILKKCPLSSPSQVNRTWISKRLCRQSTAAGGATTITLRLATTASKRALPMNGLSLWAVTLHLPTCDTKGGWKRLRS